MWSCSSCVRLNGLVYSIFLNAMASPSVTLAATECPKCGRHSIVSLSSGVYHCLHCDFHKELQPEAADKPEDGGKGGGVLFGILGFLIVIAIFV